MTPESTETEVLPPNSGDDPHEASGRVFRFIVAGVINTAFGLAIYPALLWLFPVFHDHYMVALAIAQFTGILFAFFNYKRSVFKTDTTSNVASEFGKFSSFYLINYAANWVALPLLVELAGISPIVAQTGFSLIIMICSYFWHSRITFKVPDKPSGDQP